MIEYVRHIEEYFNYNYSSFSKLIPAKMWGNKKLAEKFLQKYWLSKGEYQSIWEPIQNRIFVKKDLPNLMYHSNFEVIVLKGGCLFVKEDFEQLQKVMQSIGETYFVAIQNSQEFTKGEPMFRMKFPVDISWNELISGNYISAVLLEMNYNEYFVFGKSGKWGRYSANDYEYPLDIVGFQSELALIFNEHFKQSQKEKDKINRLLSQKN